IVERHPNVKMATSIIDAVFRILAVHYLHDDTLAQVKLDQGQGKLVTDEAGPNGDREVGDLEVPRKVAPKPALKAEPVSTGETCSCGGLLVRNGPCFTCSSCGTTQGGCG